MKNLIKTVKQCFGWMKHEETELTQEQELMWNTLKAPEPRLDVRFDPHVVSQLQNQYNAAKSANYEAQNMQAQNMHNAYGQYQQLGNNNAYRDMFGSGLWW